ncbi:MAG: enoyl-CoA hydratase/isomerase family protein [Planctomycetes bacterium]|nr:enoyl-CoA hydratase/isomerase family protein [Planctomycetota bacterium]
MSAAPRHVTVAIEQGVTTLTLNRPEVLNSLNGAMAAEIQAALAAFASDASARALLITGAGRGFCAGQDLAALVGSDGTIATDLERIVRDDYNPIVHAIRTIEKPVIAAVNGIAAGAGANLALACDLVLASDKAAFAFSFAKVGLIPDSGGTFMLPRLVGWARATAMVMLAEKIDAAAAKALGMIHQVAPAESLMSEALGLARQLATQPTAGLGLIKRALNASAINGLDAQLALEAELQGRAGATHDYREGVAAFIAKRPPAFTGQ